jgi:hypothetical protein
MWNASSASHGEKRREDGPIVFYSGAKFYTDLSGDQGDISTPLHVLGVGSDGYSNQSQNAIGCSSRNNNPPFSRTPSGSILSFRPFRIHSKVPENRPKTPELLRGDQDDDFFVDVSPDSSSLLTPLQAFDASGLGGTQPADHFAVRVETRRTINARSSGNLSRFSVPVASFKRFAHSISKSSLELFLRPVLDSEESNVTGLASIAPFTSPSARTTIPFKDLPVKTDVLYTNFIRLRPSELPPPLGYYSTTTSTSEDGDSDFGSSSSGLSQLRRDKSFFRKSFASLSDLDDSLNRIPSSPVSDAGNRSDEGNGSDSDDDEVDSIDMLAHAWEAYPDIIAAKEQEFDMEVDEKESEAPSVRSSVATMNDGSGCSHEDR